jgi:hypothetical protein
MFKRANKITALLVAAASVMSIVPAMAADSTRLGTKDGTITSAVAYKDGKYAFRGYKTDNDNEAVYYNDGNKDKSLDDVVDADVMGTFDSKYAFANDGSDQYLVDLSSGEVTDQETPSDKADTTVTKLKTALKKTNRYGELTSLTSSAINYVDKDATGALPGPKFAETWYQYAIAPVNTQANEVNGELFGFTNETGKYVDASNLANVYAYSTNKGKIVKIDEYNDYNTDTQLLAELQGAPQVLTQDADYIYALVTVKITDENTSAKTAGTTTTAAAGVSGVSTIHKYLQKISKTQGDKKDDAYLPKTVDSYEMDNKSFIDNGDVSDAYSAVIGNGTTNGDGYAVADNQYRVSGDAIYVTSVKADKVKVYALKMTKIKENAIDTAIKAGGKLDAYVVKKTGDCDQDIPNVGAVSIDVNGNTWAIDAGKIYEFKGTSKSTVYTCDRSIDELNVYDENSLIAWESNDSVYTTVGEGKATTAAEAPVAVVTPAKTGWDKLADGSWNFLDTTGTKVANNWVNVGGVWYFLKADGVMATGWVNQNGTWYFLKSSGAMATGWYNDNGTWYYLNASGAMLANTTVDGYVLGASGAWVK